VLDAASVRFFPFQLFYYEKQSGVAQYQQYQYRTFSRRHTCLRCVAEVVMSEQVSCVAVWRSGNQVGRINEVAPRRGTGYYWDG